MAARAHFSAGSIIAAHCVAFRGHRASLPDAVRRAVNGACSRPHPCISAALAWCMGYRAETLASLRYFGYSKLADGLAEGGAKLHEHEDAWLVMCSHGGADASSFPINFGTWQLS